MIKYIIQVVVENKLFIGIFFFFKKEVFEFMKSTNELLGDISYAKIRTKIMNEQRRAQDKARKELNYQ